MRGQLERTISQLQLEDKVFLLGWRTREQLQRQLAEADALVLSSDSEGVPLAILEAAALARPAIATDVGGVAEVVQSGKTGWLVRRQDVTALAGALADCLRQPEAELQRLGRSARAMVLNRTAGRSAAMLKKLFSGCEVL